jgi:hypothetical protein
MLFVIERLQLEAPHLIKRENIIDYQQKIDLAWILRKPVRD